ncbi:MAG TPA: hypothetical protein VFJ99_02310 [Solirubrobacterales bacterium]|nr:hypothetical protein [Solirubrobacterales bacterium]
MRRLGLIGGVLAVLIVLVAGCGGGGGDESNASAPVEPSEPTALSKAELVVQGDAICAEVNAAVGAAGSTSSGEGSEAVQVAGLYDGMVERLKELGPPKEEDAGYTEFVSAAEALVQAEDDVKLASEREETEALEGASAEVSTALARFQSAAREFGFERCAEAPAPPTPSGTAGESGGEEEGTGGIEGGVEETAPEEAEAAPEEAAPVEEEGAGGGAGVGGGTEGGGGGTGGGSSGGIGPG